MPAGQHALRHLLDCYCRRWVQLCRTFQKSPVNRVARPCPTECPALLLESRCRMCVVDYAVNSRCSSYQSSSAQTASMLLQSSVRQTFS